MTLAAKTLTLLAAAACAAAAAEPALARQNRGGRNNGRARLVVPADPASVAAGASFKIELRAKSHGRSEFRMQLERAPSGLAPEAWIADATGALTLAGPLVPDRFDVGEYRLRLRSRSGDALPAGAATLADLAGRAFEVRESAQVLVAGTIPALGTRVTDRDGDGEDDRRGHGADDGPDHDVDEQDGDDDGDGDGQRGRGRGSDD
jgi:hypothetical protein